MVDAKSSKLRINNIIFDIPPESIKIIHEEFNAKISSIRSSSTTRFKSGQKTISVIVETSISTGHNAISGTEVEMGSWINEQLAPLIIQVRKCPFVSVENEKIRKDVTGDAESKETIAAIVKAIQFSNSTREAEMIKIVLHLEIFNYTPFSPDFNYKEIDRNGQIFKSEIPGALFSSFMESGTTNKKNIGGYVNSYLVGESNDLEIIYKEYQTFENKETADIEKPRLVQEDWLELENPDSSKIVEVVFYRYRRFTISEFSAEKEMAAGQLLIENISGSLRTKTSRIPLLGHSIPTAQSLGAADAGISIQLFANAEEDTSLAPSESSKRLSDLVGILNLTAQNAIDYHRFAVDDVLYIKHPLINLAGYKSIPEKKIKVAGENKDLDLGQYVAFVSEGFDSSTVTGLPFCSRLQLNLAESHHSGRPVYEQTDIGRGDINRASAKLIDGLIEKYGMVINKERNEVMMTKSSEDPDYDIAESLMVYLSGNLFYLSIIPQASKREYNTPQELLDDTANLEALFEKEKPELLSIGYTKVTPLTVSLMGRLSSDLLVVLATQNSSDPRYLEYKEAMTEFQNVNYIHNSPTYPDLMLQDPLIQPDHFFWNETEIDEMAVKQRIADEIVERHADIIEEYIDGVLKENAREDVASSPGPILGAQNIVQKGTHRGSQGKTDKGYLQNPMDKKQQEENLFRTVESFKERTYSMRRSMPTFKLFFREDGQESFNDIDFDRLTSQLNNGAWKNFGDFYDVNGIIDIRLVKDKDNPADMLVIRMLNGKEDIINKSYPLPSPLSERKKKLKISNGKIRSQDEIILREGSSIELRLGYESDPNKLDIEFTGRVSSIGGGNIAEIVCQGNGVELIQHMKGVGQLSTGDASDKRTVEFISDILHDAPEVKSFGATSSKTLFGNHEFLWTGAGGRTVVENIFAPPMFTDWELFSNKTMFYSSLGGGIGAFFGPLGIAAGFAIGAGVAAVKGSYFDPDSKDGTKFVIYKQTLWDILQELTLRHPGTICGIAPFDQRSTIFFGYPEQMYFFRGMTFAEASFIKSKGVSENRVSFEEKNLRLVLEQTIGYKKMHKLSSRKELSNTLAKAESRGFVFRLDGSGDRLTRTHNPDAVAAITMRLMKPYINYHMITSEHDIIENNMTVSSDGVFNAIEVVHPNTTSNGNFSGAVGFSDYEKSDLMKADDDLYHDYIRTQTQVYHNAHTEEPTANLPNKYAISTLCRSLNGVYKGKIKILGRPGMKPHDIVFVYDSYNNIFGPVQIRSLVHTFSYKTGWVTEIFPQMIVSPSQSTIIPYVNTLKKMAMTYYLRNIKLFYLNRNKKKVEKSFISKNSEKIVASVSGVAEAGVTAGTLALAETAVRGAYGAVIASEAGGMAAAKVGALFLGKSILGLGVPIVGTLVTEYAFKGIVNWAKYREPIAILPVTRNGKAWYTGLHGLKKNTAIESIKETFSDTVEEAKYYADFLAEEFKSIF